MLDKLQKHIDKYNLLEPNERLLLTVSGGKDSVCMLHLFAQLDYPLALAHCNFSLRGVDSDEDENFVKGLANHYGLPFFSKRFETNKYAKEKGISTQMAARDLRYAWFQELCFSAQEIETCLLQNEWEWREDASNASTHYQRNEIRLLQLPSMEKENPNIRKELLQEISVNQQKYAVLQEEVKQLFPFVWKKGDTHQELYLKELLNHPQKEDLMYELLKEYGPFSWQDVFTLMEAESGKEVHNKYYRLIKNRDSLLLVVNKTQKQASVQIDKSICAMVVPISLSFSVLKRSDTMDFSDSSMAFIDLSKLFFPLTLRKWKQGDVFVPLGMQGHKKVSDFMVDEKLSILEKENTWVLCSNDDIVWVVGHRLDDRYKLVAQTEKVYLVQTLKTTK